MFARMKSESSHLLQLVRSHPFNKELFAGTLSQKLFYEYLAQDSLYLKDFSKVLSKLSKRFTNPSHVKQFQVFSDDTVKYEQAMHTKYLKIDPLPRLFSSKLNKNSIIKAYTEHLHETVDHASLEEAVASILPCFWIYNTLGLDVKPSKAHPYFDWLNSYSDPDFTKATENIIKISDELNQNNVCPIATYKIISAFLKSANFEILFWDSIYHPDLKKEEKNVCKQSA